MFDPTEKSIAELREALESGETTAVELVEQYRERYDASLNAVVVDNPEALREAAESDERRAAGETLGPLDGIPYTAKNSFMARGLTVAAGSPAFKDLVAQWDAFTVGKLRASGAILLGLTNMPPMANGGMQRGLYGRAESPYNRDYLTSAFASGSSNGSGTATAASFGAFGLGEETWSSGRAPASCNALCAYTPSRGVISVRGNWPLVPTMDVVVPHTRSMPDMLELLDVIVAEDPDTTGDFWRDQHWVAIPPVEEIRPESYRELSGESLRGVRLGVPRMYVNADPNSDITTRESVMVLWRQLRADLEAAGATVVEVDFPVVTNYEAGPRFLSEDYLATEIGPLSAWAWENFLQANGDPDLDSLAGVDGATIFPHPEGALPDRYDGFDDDIADYPRIVAEAELDTTSLPEGLAGLEKTRRLDFERWLDTTADGLNAVIFPTLADVAPADADTNPDSADIAWRNGVWVANGNLAIRHLGIPTVTVPMGVMADTDMPAGVTVAGRAWDDNRLLALGAAIEATAPGETRRIAPTLKSRSTN